mmetsp:Transcript_20070/g.36276  ORF Transcript_20070/g.36276 Transcript_20070/m.36276 type:complete len:299 (-) Transcript_20070:304-1200(-)
MGKRCGVEHQLTNAMLHCNLVAGGIPAKDASVLVELGKALILICAADVHLVGHCVGCAIARNVSWHQACVLLVGANDLRHDHHGHSIWTLPWHTLPADGCVSYWTHLIVAVQQLCSTEVWHVLICGGRASLDTSKGRLSKLHGLIVLNARCCYHHLLCGVVRINIALEMACCDLVNILIGSNGGQPEGGVSERAQVKSIIDDGTGGLLRIFKLSNECGLFLLVCGNGWSGDHVCQDVNSLLGIWLGHSHHEGRLLTAHADTEGTSNGLNLLLELLLWLLGCPHVCQLFQQIGGAGCLR